MGLFSSSQINIDQVDDFIANLKNHPQVLLYQKNWGEFVETNSYLWIKEKTELDMIFSLNFDSISNSLSRMLSSRDIKKLYEKFKACNLYCVYYACLIGVSFAIVNRKILENVNLLPQETKNIFELTFIPSYKLFELIFDNHYKNTPALSHQKDDHLLDTKNGIVRRARSAFIEGSNAVKELNYIIY